MIDKKVSISELRRMRATSNDSDSPAISEEKDELNNEKKSVFVNRGIIKNSELAKHESSDVKLNNIDGKDIETNIDSPQRDLPETNKEQNSEIEQLQKSVDSCRVSQDKREHRSSSRPLNSHNRVNQENISQKTNNNNAQQSKQKNIFEDEINILDYLEIAYRYKFMIVLITIALILVAYVYSIYQTPIYKASTKLLINNELRELKSANQNHVFNDDRQLSTWIQIIKSTSVAARVSNYLDGTVSPGAIKGAIECSTERDEERIINITVTHTDPNLAALIANYYYHAVNDYDMATRNDNYAKTIMYVEAQLEKNNRDLDSLNAVIEKLYRKHNYKNFTGDIEENFKRLSSFKDILSTTEVDLEAENANINALKSRLKEEDSEYTTETTYSEPLKMRLLNLEVDLARALTSYGEDHPKVIGIKQNIENISNLIEEGAEQNVQLKSIGNNPLKQQILSDLIISETKVISLSQRKIALARIIKSMELDPEVSSILSDLQRQKNALSTIIINLQYQLSEMRLSSSVDAYRIIQLEQAATPSNPSNNKMKLNLLIGTILGLGLGFGLSMLLNMFDNKIRNVKSLVKSFPHIPIIGTVPKLDFSPMGLDILTQKDTDENNQLKESVLTIFNEIALNFKYLIMNKEHNLIGIISSIKGEGKSTISNFLAIALARNNTKVLLIDADFYNPRISRYYGYKELPGFSEVVTEQVDLKDAIIETHFENLFILPSGKLPPSVNKLYHNDKFPEYIKSIKDFADIVIIDTPAYMYFPETSVLINQLDYSLLAVQMETTTIKSINRVFRKLDVINTTCSGFIGNRILKNIFDTAYYDYYSYGYEYYYYTLEDGSKNKRKRDKQKPDDNEGNNNDQGIKKDLGLPSKRNHKNVINKSPFKKLIDAIKEFLGISDYIDIEDDEFDEK